MAKTTDNVIRLLNAGGTLSINGENYTTDNIVRILNTAKANNSVLTVRNSDKFTTDNLIRMINAGRENLILEL